MSQLQSPPSQNKDFEELKRRIEALERQAINPANDGYQKKRAVGTESASATMTAPNFYEIKGTDPAFDMRFDITPAVDCYWEVQYNVIVVCLDAAWQRIDAVTSLVDATGASKQDEDGMTLGVEAALPGHSSLSYSSMAFIGRYRLKAETYYQVVPVFKVSSGNWNYWHGSTYLEGKAQIVGLD